MTTKISSIMGTSGVVEWVYYEPCGCSAEFGPCKAHWVSREIVFKTNTLKRADRETVRDCLGHTVGFALKEHTSCPKEAERTLARLLGVKLLLEWRKLVSSLEPKDLAALHVQTHLTIR